jgi:hypothetical protein
MPQQSNRSHDRDEKWLRRLDNEGDRHSHGNSQSNHGPVIPDPETYAKIKNALPVELKQLFVHYINSLLRREPPHGG